MIMSTPPPPLPRPPRNPTDHRITSRFRAMRYRFGYHASTTVRVFSGGCVSSVYPSKQISGIHHRIAVCDRCEPTRHSAGSVGWVLVADQDLLPKQPCQRRRSSRLHCGDCHPTGNTPVPVIRTTAAPWRW
nr:hypothetical protein Iba_chr03aCG16930 [Ipomoea batatas]